MIEKITIPTQVTSSDHIHMIVEAVKRQVHYCPEGERCKDCPLNIHGLYGHLIDIQDGSQDNNQDDNPDLYRYMSMCVLTAKYLYANCISNEDLLEALL